MAGCRARGTFPFVASLDHRRPVRPQRRRSRAELRRDAGPRPADPGASRRVRSPPLPALDDGVAGLRIARLGGYFARGGDPAAFEAVDRVAAALKAERTVELAEARRGRAPRPISSPWSRARRCISSGCATRAEDFDPDVRDRLIAGAMLPGAWVVKAQKFRRLVSRAGAGPLQGGRHPACAGDPLPRAELGQKTFVLDGKEMLVRPNLGLFTQPISFIGLPVAAVPVWTHGETLPIGVQIIAPPWREDLALRVARVLERDGVVAAPVAAFPESRHD